MLIYYVDMSNMKADPDPMPFLDSCENEVKKEEDKATEDVESECKHCGNHPSILRELDPLLVSIIETYGEWKTNKQVCFHMYMETVKVIFGPALGKGVRKKLPSCVQMQIHEMAPDEKYTGFIPSPRHLMI